MNRGDYRDIRRGQQAERAGAAKAHDDVTSDVAWVVSLPPPSIVVQAAVVAISDGGQAKELRCGENGWTCVVRDLGARRGRPLCHDEAAMEWTSAAMLNRAPDLDVAGYSSMLKGGSVWSATDPGAMQPPEGQDDYIRFPSDVVILKLKIANATGFPSEPMNADPHQPFLMPGRPRRARSFRQDGPPPAALRRCGRFGRHIRYLHRTARTSSKPWAQAMGGVREGDGRRAAAGSRRE